ncbi:hypothetical protein [Streptomyces sp. DSM 40750]|uniref:hypothetical protein n=1 Tax=Streptomyces sp. DSM 40750 TaxID=2801030 RepID=UPI00214BA9E7|nr:hypothetical protein [Streptomyces sp. DSM 40750]UUU28412.1 hypothetical protein JIX55_01760 [Streptomyces sp. DSM 40750]UUU28435.1 hypothetical protein JIX55_48985 [Streptomyces sp. DSM 40750]
MAAIGVPRPVSLRRVAGRIFQMLSDSTAATGVAPGEQAQFQIRIVPQATAGEPSCGDPLAPA